MARFFKKLYTLQKETLEDDFPETAEDKLGPNVALKVISTLKRDDCCSIKSTGFKHADGKSVEGTLEPEFKFSDYNVVLKGKFVSSNKYETTLTFNDHLVKGASVFVTGKCELGDKPKQSIDLGVDYLNKEYAAVNVKVTSPVPHFDTNDIDLYMAGVAYRQGVSVGGEVQVKPARKDVSKWTTYLQYDDSTRSGALFGKYEKNKKGVVSKKYGLGYYQKVNDKVDAALEVSTDASNINQPTVKVGGVFKCDANSTCKTRLTADSTKLRVALALKQKLSNSAKLTLGTDLNVHRLLNREGKDVGLGHLFGVTLSFFD